MSPGELAATIDIQSLRKHTNRLERAALTAGSPPNNRHTLTMGFDLSRNYIKRKMQKAGYIVTEHSFPYRVWEYDTESVGMSVSIGDDLETLSLDTTNDQVDQGTFTVYGNSGDMGATQGLTADIVFITPRLDFDSEDYQSSDGCEAEDFNGIEVTGKIALIQRGSCIFESKNGHARDAGAVGVIIFNEGNADNRMGLRFSRIDSGHEPDTSIPVFDVGFEHGKKWIEAIQNGSTISATLTIDTWIFSKELKNVIAETKNGNPNQVVMLGAHLDSVEPGPGINDNGSGSAGILEFALQFAKSKNKPTNKLRFAWWAAEEEGLLGSTAWAHDQFGELQLKAYYDTGIAKGLSLGEYQDWKQTADTSNFTDEDKMQADAAFEAAKKTKIYLNFDMIASPNYKLGLYDGDISDTYFHKDTHGDYVGVNHIPPPVGTSEIERIFETFFSSNGHVSVASALSNRSDYREFAAYGVAFGGLFTGAEVLKSTGRDCSASVIKDSDLDVDDTPDNEMAECERNNVDEVELYGGYADEPYDPCYHQACDTSENLNDEAFEINAKAITYVGAHYALQEQLFLGQSQIRKGVSATVSGSETGVASSTSSYVDSFERYRRMIPSMSEHDLEHLR